MTPQVSFSDAAFRAIIASAVQGIVAIDHSGKIELANATAEQLFGYLPGELLGKSIEVLVPERLRRAHEGHRAGYVAAPRTRPMGVGKELAGRRSDGSEFPIEVSLSYAEDASLSIAFITDISVRKSLDREQQQLAALVDSSQDFIELATPDADHILYINQAGREMLGLPGIEDVRKMSVSDVPIRPASAYREVMDAIASHGYWRGEFNYIHQKTGDEIPADAFAFLVRDKTGGQPIALAIVSRDIRERKRNHQQLRALTAQLLNAQEEERSRIARELHDGPTQDLALLAAELGLLQKKASADQQPDFTALRERVLAISEDVRLLAHQFHPSVLEHSGLVAALEAYCREAAPRAGISIRFIAGQDLGPIPKLIAVPLYRITQEALHNVIKHSSATSATVTLKKVEMDNGKPGLRLAIIDNGKGFLIEHVRNNGSGLGLVSIEERAGLVQGTFKISSVPAEGTRVEVEVPLTEA